MLIAESGLESETREAWYRAGIRGTDELRRPAVELLARPGITGSVLDETVRGLHEHQYGLPAFVGASRIMATTTDDLEMLRLRVVERFSLAEIAEMLVLSRECVRQRLRSRFGLSGGRPAALEQGRKCQRCAIEDDQPASSLRCLSGADLLSDSAGCVEAERGVERGVG